MATENDAKISTTNKEDTDFELSADMQCEGDDESSLAEEEQMESPEQIRDEVSALERESDMPIEDLLALYGYDDDGGTVAYGSSSPNGSEAVTQENAVAVETVEDEGTSKTEKSSGPADNRQEEARPEKAKSDLRQLFQSRGRMQVNVSHYSDSSSEDEDYIPLEDWKKEIRVGEEYQAVVPSQPDVVYRIPAEMEGNILLWDPSRIDQEKVTRYLERAVWRAPESFNGIEALPLGAPDGDNERALFVLHKCAYQVQRALEVLPRETDSPLRALPAPWSEEDCAGFETGLRLFGKDFPSILEKLPGRSLCDLVEFYYLWKKTERHDHFVQQYQLSGRQDCAIPAHLDGLEKYGDTDLESAFSSRAPSPGRGDNTSTGESMTFPRTSNAESAMRVGKAERDDVLKMANRAGMTSLASALVVESGHSYARHVTEGKRKAEEMADMNRRKRGRVPVKIGPKHEDHTYNTADEGQEDETSTSTGTRAFSLPTLPAQVKQETSNTAADYLIAKETLPESSDDSFNENKTK